MVFHYEPNILAVFVIKKYFFYFVSRIRIISNLKTLTIKKRLKFLVFLYDLGRNFLYNLLLIFLSVFENLHKNQINFVSYFNNITFFI